MRLLRVSFDHISFLIHDDAFPIIGVILVFMGVKDETNEDRSRKPLLITNHIKNSYFFHVLLDQKLFHIDSSSFGPIFQH